MGCNLSEAWDEIQVRLMERSSSGQWHNDPEQWHNDPGGNRGLVPPNFESVYGVLSTFIPHPDR